MGDWWASLDGIAQIYWIIAIPATAIFLIILILNLVAGVDADVDLDADVDGEIGFQFISLKNLLGFFTIFGWSGLACLEADMSNTSTIIISFICGLAMMVIMATLFYFMSKLTEDGTLNINNAKNGIGETYLTIPPRRTGFGKVQIKVQGGLHELEAVTDSETEISTGRLVTVVDVLNDELLLVKENK